ncbi:MAG: 50S ribosomal protein L7Ae [Candidatus Bilamarchaeaceae archaeon]
MASYVKYKTPEEVVASIIEALSVAKDTGRLRKGINETTKSVEKKAAKLVVMAEDVQPEEIIIHVPMLCEERGIPYAYVPSKKELGAAVGIPVGTSSIAIEEAGGANELLQGILKRLPKQAAHAAPAAEAKEGAPAEARAEKPKAEKPKKASRQKKEEKKE